MNPNLFDLIKVYVAEKYPNLSVDNWVSSETDSLPEDQIRISLAPLKPFQVDVGRHSLISITPDFIYYYQGGACFWDSCKADVRTPDFFQKLDLAIERAIERRRK